MTNVRDETLHSLTKVMSMDICSLDDDNNTEPCAKIEYLYFIYKRGCNSLSRLDGAYKIPLKYAVHCDLFKVAIESAMAHQSTDVEDYIVELFDSQNLISVTTLDWIFVQYFPLFSSSLSSFVFSAGEAESPLARCPRSAAWLSEFYAREGLMGFERLLRSVQYLGVERLFDCGAQWCARLFEDRSLEEISTLLRL